MSVNLFRSKDNQKRNYVTTRASEEDVDKNHYEFLGILPPDFEIDDAGSSDDPMRLGIYSKGELIKKIENFKGYAERNVVMLTNLKDKLVKLAK